MHDDIALHSVVTACTAARHRHFALDRCALAQAVHRRDRSRNRAKAWERRFNHPIMRLIGYTVFTQKFGENGVVGRSSLSNPAVNIPETQTGPSPLHWLQSRFDTGHQTLHPESDRIGGLRDGTLRGSRAVVGWSSWRRRRIHRQDPHGYSRARLYCHVRTILCLSTSVGTGAYLLQRSARVCLPRSTKFASREPGNLRLCLGHHWSD